MKRYTINLTMWDAKNPDDEDLITEETVLEASSYKEAKRLFEEAQGLLYREMGVKP